MVRHLSEDSYWKPQNLSGLPLVREKSGKFKVREKSGNLIICQGNLEFYGKSGKFKKSQGNLWKFIFHNMLRWSISRSKNFPLAPSALASLFSTHFNLNLPLFTKVCYLKHIQSCSWWLSWYIIILIRTCLNFCMFDWSGKNRDKSGKGQGKVREFWYLVWVATLPAYWSWLFLTIKMLAA